MESDGNEDRQGAHSCTGVNDSGVKADRPKPSGNQNNNSGSNKRQREDDSKWAWKKIPPRTGKPSTILKNKKTYHWCPKHAMWTVHTPEECKLTKKQSAVANVATDTSKEDDKDKEKTNDKVQVDQAYQSIITSGGRVFA
jgi:hypothetical protein